MQSHNIVFTGKDEVRVVTEPVREPGPSEVVMKATQSLISAGAESICLSRLFAPSSHWDR